MRASPLRRRAPDHRVSQGIKRVATPPVSYPFVSLQIVQTSDLRKPAGPRKGPLPPPQNITKKGMTVAEGRSAVARRRALRGAIARGSATWPDARRR